MILHLGGWECGQQLLTVIIIIIISILVSVIVHVIEVKAFITMSDNCLSFMFEISRSFIF